jgi:hypothetical protein
MTTAQTLSPDRPLRPVWTPQDAEEAREHLQAEKRRWRVFLTAKGLLLGYLKATASVATKAFHRLHLDSATRMIRRTAGWLFGGVSLVRRGLTTAGFRPGIAWLLTTSFGQGLVKKASQAVAGVVHRAAKSLKTGLIWCLRLFGSRGKRLASKLDAKLDALRVWTAKRLQPLMTPIGDVLRPQGLPMQTLGTLAKGKALSALLARFLPRPWNILARVLANLAVLPASIRREAVRHVTGWTSKQATPTDSPDGPPDDDPTSSAAAVPADVVDLEEERVRHEQASEARALANLERYPAKKRSTTAKRKR